MKNVLLISPYFLPSNLAAVHRVRLMSGHLASFGWHPIIITVDSSLYEERPAVPELLHLVPSSVEIVSVRAFPASLCRPLGIGDISLRAQASLRRTVAELVEKLTPAVIFVTVLPGYASLIGAWAKRRFNIPFVLDYQDPWVPRGPKPPLEWTKAGMSKRLARWLEPQVLPFVDAITAVSDETLASLRERKLLSAATPVEIIPIGADVADFAIARQFGRSSIDPRTGGFHVAYLGTITHRMRPALEAFLQAVRTVRDSETKSILIHLIGTFEPDMKGLVEQMGLHSCVRVTPTRISYLDALCSMEDADLLLLLGSTDSHYTASKLFPYWLSGKPIMAIFHEASEVVPLSRELGGVHLSLFNSQNNPAMNIDQIASVLRRAMKGELTMPARRENAFVQYSAKSVAKRYAEIFTKVSTRSA
ncbi:MAG: hypothetical protein V7609_810 [Verrucomicrobiota bacterium]